MESSHAAGTSTPPPPLAVPLENLPAAIDHVYGVAMATQARLQEQGAQLGALATSLTEIRALNAAQAHHPPPFYPPIPVPPPPPPPIFPTDAKLRLPSAVAFDPSLPDVNIHAWIYATHSYFEANGINEVSAVKYLPQLLRGNALTWHMSYTSEYGRFPDWASFCAVLLQQFLPANHEDNLRRKLRHHRQTGSVQDYTAGFQAILSQLRDVTGPAALFAYVSGLSPAVRDAVCLHPHPDYHSAAGMAARVFCQRDAYRTPSGARRDTPFTNLPASGASSSRSGAQPMDLHAVQQWDSDSDDGDAVYLAAASVKAGAAAGTVRLCRRCGLPGHSSPLCLAPSPNPALSAAPPPFGRPPRT